MVAAPPMSAGDLAALPDDERGELLDGAMLPMTPVKEDHSRVVTELLWAIRDWLEAHRIGKVAAERGFLLRSNPDTVLAPDLSFVFHTRIAWRARHNARSSPNTRVTSQATSRKVADKDVRYKVQTSEPAIFVVTSSRVRR